MRIDFDYQKQLVNIRDLIKGLVDELTKQEKNALVFHLEVLWNQRFLEAACSVSGIGIHRNGDGGYRFSIVPLRQTA